MEDRRLESTGDPGHSEDAPRAWTPPSMPDDAQALGLDRNTEEGAWVSFAAGLDGAKRLAPADAWPAGLLGLASCCSCAASCLR